MSSGRHYTPDEDAIIRSRYPTSPVKELLALLPDRRPNGIRQRAHELGVRKRMEHREVGKPLDGPVLTRLTEAERGYLAGLIDGEGCLRLSRSKSRRGSPVYHVQVSISNTSKSLAGWLVEKLPGSIYYSGRPAHSRWRERYSWKLSGNRRAISFLQEIAPYLIIKRPQAELLAGGYVHLPAEEREALYRRLAEMKRDA